MFFHVLISRHEPVSWRPIQEWPRAFLDVTEGELLAQFVVPARSARDIEFRGCVIKSSEVDHIIIAESDQASTEDTESRKSYDARSSSLFVYGLGIEPFDMWFASEARDVTIRYLTLSEQVRKRPDRSEAVGPLSGSMTVKSSATRVRVFLCHASEDRVTTRKLCNRLRSDGVDPWLDEQRLLAGQDWRYEIEQAVAASDVVLVCLTRHAVEKIGFVQREVGRAVELAAERPEGAVYIIPARLEECELPHRLRRWQRVDLFKADGYKQLLASLRLLRR